MLLRHLHALAAVTPALLWASVARADTVSFEGLSLRVAEAAPLAGDSVALTVQEETTVVLEAEAGRAVAMSYARSPALLGSLSLEDLSSLLHLALLQGHTDILEEALGTLLSADSARSVEDIAKASRVVVAEREGAHALARFVDRGADAVARDRACEALMYAPGPELLRLLRAGLPCDEKAIGRSAALLGEGQIEAGILLLEVAGARNPQSGASALALSLREATDAASRGDDDAFVAAWSRLQEAPSASDTLQMAKAGGVRALLRDSLSRGRLHIALVLLLAVPFRERSTLHHEALVRVILERPDLLEERLPDAEAAALVIAYARKDDDIRRALVAWAEGRARHGMDGKLSEDLIEAAWVMGGGDVRQHPDLARQTIGLLRRRGEDEVAQRIENELERRAGWTGWAVFASVMAALVVALVRRRSGKWSPEVGPRGATGEVSAASEELIREYRSCLADFNLGVSASLLDIKSAYRNIIKKTHPDRSSASSEVAPERFLVAKQRYEELMRLYELVHRRRNTLHKDQGAATS